jgi:hypothetical protein
MGAVRPSDDYSEWAAGAAAFKRAHPDDTAVAFRCFDVWSSCSSKYKGTEATRCKFDEVPADYDGTAAPLMLDMLHWRARRRAETVLGALYSPTAHWQKSSAFDDLSPESLADVTFRPKGAESIEPGSLKPKDGILALEYLSYCWSGIVYEQIIAGFSIPQAVLDEVKEPDDQRRLEIDVADRCLHIWGGKDLAADTAALADAIIAADPQLYRIDQTLVRLSKPASDPATAARVRKIYRYEKSPGEAGDPALHTGERLAPLLPSDTEALREIIAEHVATKRRINDGTKKEPIWREEIASFPFKPGTALHVGPDAGILKDLGKRALVERVPEIVGVVTAPVMPELPPSTKSSDLIQPGADRLITRPGFDVASGLYLAPIGSAFDVPETPSAADVETAANLLQEPWADFPFCFARR